MSLPSDRGDPAGQRQRQAAGVFPFETDPHRQGKVYSAESPRRKGARPFNRRMSAGNYGIYQFRTAEKEQGIVKRMEDRGSFAHGGDLRQQLLFEDFQKEIWDLPRAL